MFGFLESPSVITDEGRIHTLLTRGIAGVYPSKEEVMTLLKSGKRTRLYLGIDPTGPSLHLGHAIVLKVLAEFQALGHEVILLIGDFTGMIGDPTGKSFARAPLTHAQVRGNAGTYKKQASTFLSFTGKNPATLRYNGEWLAPMSLEKVLSLASHVTVEQMLKRDMFEKRQQDGRPIFIHEFLYPLMQGYDSVAMEVDGEVGGNDQTFNMLMGRTLVKEFLHKEKFVLTTKLLEDASGKKMGKTEGNMITLADSSKDMYGKVMSWTDGMIAPGFELCTDISEATLMEIQKELSGGANPRDAKMRLAREVVTLYHGRDKALGAEADFIAAFQRGHAPEDMPEVSVLRNALLVDVLVPTLVKSKSELRRLLAEGAIAKIDGETLIDSTMPLQETMVVRVGKHRFLKIKIM